MLRFLTRWIAFFRPLPGWEQRYLMARSGTTDWPNPYTETKQPRIIPWPVEWIPTRALRPGEDVTEEAAVRGFEFRDIVCVDSGRKISGRLGMLCCRCGVPLHPESAYPARGMPSFDAPYCGRCHWVIKFFV